MKMFNPKIIRFFIFCFICIITIEIVVEAEKSNDSVNSVDNPSHIPITLMDNEPTMIPEHQTIAVNEDDESSENSDEEWFDVDVKEYDHFKKKLNKFFSRRYSRHYRHCPRFYQHYPPGYRCELIEYIVYQDTAGILYKVGGIFGTNNNSKTLEEKEILVFEDMRRNIQWTWP